MAVQGEEAHAIKVKRWTKCKCTWSTASTGLHQVKMAALCEVERPTLLAKVNTCTL